jgi:gluconate 5-dehydrogenase
MFDLKDKVCLITGSYGYLKTKIVVYLFKKNSNVIISGRTEEKLNKQFNDLKKKYKNVDKVIIDLSIIDNFKETISNIFNKYNRLDVIINNSNSSNNISKLDDKSNFDLENSFKINCAGTFELIKTTIPYLIKTGQTFNVSPCVINFTSIYSSFSPKKHKYSSLENINPIEYGMTKSAILQMTKYLAAYYGDKNVRFNSIAPGCFPNINKISDEKFLDNLKKKCPMNRIGKPKDLSGIIIFLSSDASSFITGQNIFIDGGANCWI